MSGPAVNRSDLLTALTVIEIAVLLCFLARWYGRRWGWRNTGARLRAYLRAVLADLARPVCDVYRFHRQVRLVRNRLTDPRLSEILDAGTGAVISALTEQPDDWPYASLVSSTSIAVAVAGSSRPVPPDPWQDQDGWWWANRNDVTSSTQPVSRFPAGWMDGEPAPSIRSCHVAVGVQADALLLLDLERGQSMLEVIGDQRAVSSLICAIAAQLTTGLAGTTGADVTVTAGVHPRFAGPVLPDVLDRLEGEAARGYVNGGQAPTTVVVCGVLEPTDAARIAGLAEALPSLRVISAGPYPGARWRVPVTAAGEVIAPDLGLWADSSSLERAIAGVLRSRLRATTRVGRPLGAPVPAPSRSAAAEPISRTTVPEDTSHDLAEPAPTAAASEAASISAAVTTGPTAGRHEAQPDEAAAASRQNGFGNRVGAAAPGATQPSPED